MFDAWLDYYREPLFVLFPVVSSLIAAGAFLVFALPFTWLSLRPPRWAERFRIQARRGRNVAVFGPSMRLWAINNAAMLVGAVVAWPALRLSGVHAGPLPPWFQVVGEVVLFVYLDDFLYYWMHRAFHHRRLFGAVHALHHRVLAPWAITGHYMHPVEYVATGSLFLVGPILLGSHVVTLWIWVAMRQWEAAEGHSGFDFTISPTKLFPGSHGAVHHDFHHARIKGNYAGFLAIWDGVFGTLVTGYAEARRRHRERVRGAPGA